MEAFTKKRDEAGFTLIELLIVIVILGILAAIVVFAVGTTGANSAQAACRSDAKSVEVALEAYKAQNGGVYPGAPTTPADTGATTGWGALLHPGTNNGAPFLRAVPGSSHYVIWWDGTSGNVYVGGPGSTFPTLITTPGTTDMNFDTNVDACTTYAK